MGQSIHLQTISPARLLERLVIRVGAEPDYSHHLVSLQAGKSSLIGSVTGLFDSGETYRILRD